MSTRSMLVAAASAAALTITAGHATAAGSCVSDGGFKITARTNITCAAAKKVAARQTAEKPLPKGWKCTKGVTIIPKGKCTKGAQSFKYGM